MTGSQKVFHYTEEKDELKKRLAGQDIVLLGGCFDILHYGHLTFLKKVRELGTQVVIALEPDEFIRGKKCKEPIHTQKQRAEILSHLDLVDVVILLPLFTDNDDYYQLVDFVRPAIIACTTGDPNLVYKEEQAKTVKAKMVIIDTVEGFSSSAIQQYASLSSN